jgi:SAM-dependent methyltransferase
VAQQRARRRQSPAARGGGQSGALERGGERLEIVCGRVVDLDLTRTQELTQLCQVSPVGGDGVARGSALEGQVREEVCDRVHTRNLRVSAPVPCRTVSTHAGGSRTAPTDAVMWLDGEPLAMRVSPGVHTPSPFTQVLVAALPRVDGLEVIDAGCGAGAVTVALLRRGAAHVSAWDIVPAAVEDTLENVRRYADPARVTPMLGAFDCLADVHADLLVTNPPQRPRSVWEQLPADARGVGAGGEDGLEKLELILANTQAPRVITSISTLTAPDLAPLARQYGFERATLLADVQGAHDPIWRYAGSLEDARIRVWDLRRA